ncbi:hypothetical protein [Streptomyces sp. NPDC058045]|uniref:hypothetical protein n=1 Tax=Streptomyces sp. NPDC058045 TaxID=3346311 RepID=UPI0036E0756C
MSRLPASTAPPAVPVAAPRAVPGFAEVWPADAGTFDAPDDGALLSATWADPGAPTKLLALDIRLPDRPGRVFRVVKGWTYDLEREAQCAAEEHEPGGGAPYPGRVFLAWDGARLVPHPEREDAARTGVLTTAMHAVVLTTLCHDGDAGFTGERLAGELGERGLIGWRGMRTAVRGLVGTFEASPARMVRVLEKRPRTLPVLWPVLVDSITVAGAAGTLPRWLNRVLDLAVLYAPHLAEAERRGWIPAGAAAFPGLERIAGRKGRSAAVTKARALLATVRGSARR